MAADLWGVTKRPRKQRISQEQMEGTFGLGLGLVWRSVILFLSLGLWRDSDKAVGDIRQEISAISKSSVLCGVRCHRGVVLQLPPTHEIHLKLQPKPQNATSDVQCKKNYSQTSRNKCISRCARNQDVNSYQSFRSLLYQGFTRLSLSRIGRTTGSQNAKLATDPRAMPSFLVRDPARQHADRMTIDLGDRKWDTGSAVSLKSLDH